MQNIQPDPKAGALRLVVVIGNTTTTLAVFSGSGEPSIDSLPSDRFAFPDTMREVLGRVAQRHGTPDAVTICSVVPELAASVSAVIESIFAVPVLNIGSAIRLPFTLDYGNSHTFGADRVALCAWSRHLFGEKAVIAVDIGTAITFDVLGSDGRYRGGLIMPGIDMMAAALHARTAQLPLIGIAKPESLLGRSTGECIRSGIFWGVVNQLGGLIDAIADELIRENGESSVEVIATGGNSRLIASELETVSVIDELAVIRGSDLLLQLNLH